MGGVSVLVDGETSICIPLAPDGSVLLWAGVTFPSDPVMDLNVPVLPECTDWKSSLVMDDPDLKVSKSLGLVEKNPLELESPHDDPV